MTREELDAYLAQKEQEKGLRPGEFRALWQQESGGSIDPNLKGVYLPKHGTAASGPFQVMPNMHPQFPVGGSLKDQADYAVQFYAGGGGTPEQRMRRYYGTGVAPKGFPTTDQYVAQTMGRMGQQPTQQQQQAPSAPVSQEQEMASPNFQGSSYEPQYMEIPQPSNYDDLPQVPKPRELTGVNKWLANPLTQMGAAIMAASGSPLGAPIGYGIASAASGLGDAQKAENDLYELQMKREQARRQLMTEDRKSRMEAMDWNQKQAAMVQLMTLADQYDAKGDPLTAAKIRAGIKSGLDENFSLTPKYVYDPETKTTKEITYSSAGKRMERDLGKSIPLGESPDLKGAQASATAAGKVLGENEATQTIKAPQIISAADNSLKLLDAFKKHPGKEWVTGPVASKVPEAAFSGTPGAGYIALQNQILGGEFLNAFESLRGGGAITEIEGQKATQARTRISRALNDADRTQAINDLREIINIGKARAAAGIRVPNPYTGNFGGSATSPATQSPAAAQPAGPPPSQAGGGGWGIKRID